MPQLCTVCTHPQHKQINLALVRREQSNRAIASQYKIGRAAVDRHEKDHLPEVLLRALDGEKQEEADEVMAEVKRCIQLTNKLLSACDEWLSDPENPDKYTLDPRANEMRVVYSYDTAEGKTLKKREGLQSLINRIEKKLDVEVLNVETKSADPRELLLKAVAQLRPVAELMAKLEGRLKGDQGSQDGQLLTMAQINILANKYEIVVREQS